MDVIVKIWHHGGWFLIIWWFLCFAFSLISSLCFIWNVYWHVKCLKNEKVKKCKQNVLRVRVCVYRARAVVMVTFDGSMDPGSDAAALTGFASEKWASFDEILNKIILLSSHIHIDCVYLMKCLLNIDQMVKCDGINYIMEMSYVVCKWGQTRVR